MVADDTGKVWEYLRQQKQEGSGTGRFDIVLDNAGVRVPRGPGPCWVSAQERFSTKAVLHGKRMPWFVSDVNSKDMEDLIQGFMNGTLYGDLDSPDEQELAEAGKNWQHLNDLGRMELKIHSFWTTQQPFGRMPHVAPEVYAELAGADLVLFKGDLKYRELTYDGNWRRTLSFGKALGPMAGKLKGKGDESPGVENVQCRCVRWVASWRGRDTAAKLV